MTPFSVVIPSRNIENLGLCVGAIRKAGEACRIIVVDDGLSLSVFRGLGIEAVLGIKPFCFARNVNLGIKAAGTDDVILLNDDALLVSKGGFTRLAEAAVRNPEYGILSSACNNVGNPN